MLTIDNIFPKDLNIKGEDNKKKRLENLLKYIINPLENLGYEFEIIRTVSEIPITYHIDNTESNYNLYNGFGVDLKEKNINKQTGLYLMLQNKIVPVTTLCNFGDYIHVAYDPSKIIEETTSTESKINLYDLSSEEQLKVIKKLLNITE